MQSQSAHKELGDEDFKVFSGYNVCKEITQI